MIQFIVFSRNRPLQLYGYLTSLLQQVTDAECSVTVLAKVEQPYHVAYADLANEFPEAGFCYEADFAGQLPLLVNDAEYTCFGCDDVVFVAPIDEAPIAAELAEESPVLGVSLRLGLNVRRGMFGDRMPRPQFETTMPMLTWDITTSAGDWAYPWEVLGTVYRTDFVREMVAAINPGNPSQLEARGAQWSVWQKHTERRQLAAFPSARLVVPTVNIVQSEYPGNGIIGHRTLSPELLLECWNAGLRLDVERYRQTIYDTWRIPDFYLRRCG